MNEKIMEALGFQKEMDNVKQGKCPFCGTVITPEILDEMSPSDYNEYQISGLCSKCQ